MITAVTTSLQKRILVGFFVLSIVFVIAAGFGATVSSQTGEAPLTGFAWSDTIGWISMNCSDLGTCGTSSYGMQIQADGVLSGHAWSDNIGWISANASDLSGCPSGTCEARFSQGELTGWFKALSGGTDQSGGWDGWISLSGSNYGISADAGEFSGYAWGSDVVGWVSFSTPYSSVRTPFQECTPEYFCSGDDLYETNEYCIDTFVQDCSDSGLICSGGACVIPPEPKGSIRSNPVIVSRFESTVQIIWQTEDVVEDSCGVAGTNGDGGPSGGAEWNTDNSPTEGVTSSPLVEETTYTLTCDGLDGSTLVRTAVVRPAPGWTEF